MVRIESMTFGYGKRPLFEDLDLDLEPGNVYGLLGLNGAGKTSLLKLMAGALRPQGGSIRAFGAEPCRRGVPFLADTVFVPEDPWFPALKPAAWLDRYAVFRPAFDRTRFAALSEEFALDADKQLTKYSYGQRKKFALAAALSSGARLVLLDEPTNGLDIPSKSQFRRALAKSAGEESIILVSTHQVRDLERLIDPALIVHGGKVLFSLGAEEISGKLGAARLSELGEGVVYAERDSVGYSALVDRARFNAGEGTGSWGGRQAEVQAADLELVFNAAIAAPGRLAAALAGEKLAPLGPDDLEALAAAIGAAASAAEARAGAAQAAKAKNKMKEAAK
ncbi:ABC transporter ATP-binding protein [bacterium]|nr:ABC transporter ATP-binding protein [bacterium]